LDLSAAFGWLPPANRYPAPSSLYTPRASFWPVNPDGVAARRAQSPTPMADYGFEFRLVQRQTIVFTL
jgi:hypothetical protein